jgi:SAM-dependent methyltransferase
VAEFYGEDLAAIHAAGFGQLAEAAAGEVLAFLGDAAAGARVLDLGCGAGALAAILAAAGVQVWGADLSQQLLAIARERVPSAEFVQGSIHELELPPARAVCAIGEVVNYLADPAAGEAALAAFFARAHAALDPGGLLLFDAAAPGRGSSRRFTEGDDWAVGAIAEESGGQLTRRITTFRRVGELWRRSQETHVLRLLPPPRVLAALDAAGFDAILGDGYGALTLPPGLVSYRAVRRP